MPSFFMAKSERGLRTQMLDGQGLNKRLQGLRIYSSKFLGDHGQPTLRCNAASSTSSTSIFLELLTKSEKVTFFKFNAAVSAVEKPAVRLHCEDAGFLKPSLENGQTFKKDPIFKLFSKWLTWSVTSKREPATGAVTGDTWRDFVREYQNGQNKLNFCEILEFGDAEPIEGFLHQDGQLVSAVLSVRGIPAMKKTLRPAANGLIIDLELTMFALLLSELDGVPVAAHVRECDWTAASVTRAPLRTHGSNTSAWPLLALVPSFCDGKLCYKDLCVAQFVGLWQFRQVPRHPRKRCPERACAWGIRKGKWTTKLHKKNQKKIRARVTPAITMTIDE